MRTTSTPDAALAADQQWTGLGHRNCGPECGHCNLFPAQPAPTLPEVIAAVTALEQARIPVRDDVSAADALNLLYAAVTGDDSTLGRLVRDLLPGHLVFPGTGQPAPDCEHCRGTGELPGPGDPDGLDTVHCHCRCDVCMCGAALCYGLCETLATMLDALVLHGLPTGAVDVPRTLAALQVDAVRRIVSAITKPTEPEVTPVDGSPGAVIVTVCDETELPFIESRLKIHGFRSHRQDTDGRSATVSIIAIPLH